MTAPLTKKEDGLPVGRSALVLAGLAALATAAYFGWLASLGRFLAGTALGLLLVAFWRRRRRPSPPLHVRAQNLADDIQFTWTQPRRPKKLDRYSIEGFDGERWLLVHEHMSTITHARHPRSAHPTVTQWRVTATNRHGISRPSEEVALTSSELGESVEKPTEGPSS